MKKTGALLLLVAAMLVAVPAYNTAFAAQRGPGQAQGQQAGQGYGPGPGWQHPAISPEQQAIYEKTANDYYTKARPMQNQIWTKQTELEYLSRNAKTEPKEISKAVADIAALREKCQALRSTTADKLAKDLNISTEHAYALLGGGRGGYGGHGCGAGMMSGQRGGGMHRGDWGGHRGWHR